MTVILAAALVIGVITACVGPLYYCKKSTQGQEHRDNEPGDVESPLVHIKISHPHHADCLTRDVCDNGQDSIDANDEQDDTIIREVTPSPEQKRQIVPVKPPRKRRNVQPDYAQNSDNGESSKNCILKNGRSSTGVWSSSLRNQLENMTNSSSEAYAVTRVVTAQVERCPNVSMSTNNETAEAFRNQSVPPKDINSIHLVSREGGCPKDEKGGHRLSSVVAKKWRSLKRKLTLSRSNKSTTQKTTEDVETQRVKHSIPVSRPRSPVEHTMMLQKNRLVDASTSTKISSNIVDTKQRASEDFIRRDEPCRDNESTNSRTEVLQDVATMIQRRSVNGKSVCDVKITGLSMNQSELLDLFEASGGKSHSASIVTTEEASVICIKFHRRRNAESQIDARRDSPAMSGLRKFYRNLPEKFEDVTFSRLFRSQEQSASNYPTDFNTPRNETSYTGLPKFGRSMSTDKSSFIRDRNLSRRNESKWSPFVR